MPAESKTTLAKPLQAKDFLKPRVFTYLPDEGLQGENIPSHILWDNIKVGSIQISFRPPLKLKDVFNAESWDIHDTTIVINKLEVEGYVGLSFESSKVSDLEVTVPVEYLITLPNGDIIKEIKKVRLFRPQLELKVPTTSISIDASTGFIKGRLKAKNVGRGTLIMRISAAEDSPIKLETPPEHREFAERFMSDLQIEMSKLADEFPVFKPYWDEILIWDKKEFMELSAEERSKFTQYLNNLANLLAGDKKLLLGFVEAYAKAFAKNTELIETVRKIISVYESLVAKDILLLNPLDEVILLDKEGELALEISQTDRVLDTYDDVKLPRIKLTSPKGIRVPAYRLFEWG
jgi:hypothetical protein